MLITAIQIRRIENSGTKMQGIVTVTLDEMIAIHDIKVLKMVTVCSWLCRAALLSQIHLRMLCIQLTVMLDRYLNVWYLLPMKWRIV